MTAPQQNVLVTGGAVGIGLGIARAFAQQRARVAITTHERRPPEDLTTLGVSAFDLDVTDSTAVSETFRRVADGFDGRIDVLVNNAGGLVARIPTAEMTDEHWRRVLDLNLSSTFYCIRAALPFMDRGGRIITISSLAAHNGGGAGAAAYAASKAGTEGLTRALAKELGPRGIAVTAIAPGLILDTPFHERFTPEADQRATIASTPIGRAGSPADVADAVLYLASARGHFASGAVLALNGAAAFH